MRLFLPLVLFLFSGVAYSCEEPIVGNWFKLNKDSVGCMLDNKLCIFSYDLEDCRVTANGIVNLNGFFVSPASFQEMYRVIENRNCQLLEKGFFTEDNGLDFRIYNKKMKPIKTIKFSKEYCE